MLKDQALRWVKERCPKCDFTSGSNMNLLFELAFERYEHIQNNEYHLDCNFDFKILWMGIETELLCTNNRNFRR